MMKALAPTKSDAIGSSARRTVRGQFKIAQDQPLAIGRLMLRHKALVLTPIVGRRQSDQGCTGAPRKLRRERRVVAMGMGDDDPADRAPARKMHSRCGASSGRDETAISCSPSK